MLKLVFSAYKYWMMPSKQGKILACTFTGPAVAVVVDGNEFNGNYVLSTFLYLNLRKVENHSARAARRNQKLCCSKGYIYVI